MSHKSDIKNVGLIAGTIHRLLPNIRYLRNTSSKDID